MPSGPPVVLSIAGFDPSSGAGVTADIKTLAGGRVDAKRMDSVRSNLRYSNIMGLDKADALAQSLAEYTALTGEVDYLDKEFVALDALKPGDLSAFARKYMQDINRTTVTLVSAAGSAK